MLPGMFNIILGATFDESLEGVIRVSVVATGIDSEINTAAEPNQQLMNDAAERLRQSAMARQGQLATEAAASAAAVEAKPDTASVEKELEIPSASTLEIQRQAPAVPFEAESADFADPISDDEFQNALEEQLSVATTTAATPAPIPAPAAESAPRIPAVEDFPAVAQQKLAPQPKTS